MLKFSKTKKQTSAVSSKGFTLIEVVLVLAIGGLIFLLAFVAFQQVSRNRRDTQRRSDMQRLVAELENYKVNTGRYPNWGHWAFGGEFPDFMTQYMKGNDFKDPRGAVYLSAGVTTTTIAPNPDYQYWPVQYHLNNKCNGSNATPAQGSIAVRTKLENGAIYCRSSQ